MNVIFFLLFSTMVFATLPGTEEICPDGSMLVEYVSPVTGNKKKVCMKDMVKVGEPSVRASATSAPVASVTLDTKYIKAIQHLLKILSRQSINDTVLFNVTKCDKNPVAWVKMALTKQPATFSYAYKEDCDVQGNFTANFGEPPFELSLQLRNLMEFNKASMKVLQNAESGSRGILYTFKAKEGILFSATDKIEFEADYEIEINPLTGASYRETQNGSIHIKSHNGKPVNLKEALYH
jgi:hypothetical protein